MKNVLVIATFLITIHVYKGHELNGFVLEQCSECVSQWFDPWLLSKTEK